MESPVGTSNRYKRYCEARSPAKPLESPKEPDGWKEVTIESLESHVKESLSAPKEKKTPKPHKKRTNFQRRNLKTFQPPPPKIGAPTTFNQEIADYICDQIANGVPITQICERSDMPGVKTFYAWLDTYPSFQQAYVRARTRQGELSASQIKELCDEPPRMITRPDGSQVVDNGWVTWQKNRVEARKWIAAKLTPKVYGEKLTVDGMTTNNNTLALNMSTQQLAAELHKLALGGALPDGVKLLESGKIEIDADYQVIEPK